MNYSIIALTLAGVVVFALIRNRNQKVIASLAAQDKTPPLTPSRAASNPYEGLRKLALGVSPAELSLVLPDDQTVVYGVVMDLDLGQGIGTFVAFQTGDASMYLSNGGGAIGGQGHENVQQAARDFVALAQTFLHKALLDNSIPLPDKNCVRFYFLTNKGRFSAQESLENIDSSRSAWLPLFKAGNTLINEIHRSESRKG